MEQSLILKYFSLFSDLSGEDLEKWSFLCENATKLILSLLKANASIDANKERLATTIAAIAYSEYLLLEEAFGSRAEQVSIGDISFRSDASSAIKQDSNGIKEYFLGQVSDLIIANSFAFVLVGSDKHSSENS